MQMAFRFVNNENAAGLGCNNRTYNKQCSSLAIGELVNRIHGSIPLGCKPITSDSEPDRETRNVERMINFGDRGYLVYGLAALRLLLS
jgi:hypothetical protein